MNALQLGTETAKDIFLPRMGDATLRRDIAALPKIPNQILVFGRGATSVPVSGMFLGHTFIGIEGQVETLYGSHFVGYALEAARVNFMSRQTQEHKNSGAIALLTSWLADNANDDEQKDTFGYLKNAVDEDRPSSRKIFR